MNRRRRTDPRSGIALLMAIFALLLLSAIALSMIYAANIETGVSSSFRDHELSSYAAASGLQIARDLVRPGAALDPELAGGVLQANAALQGLPSLTAKNVLYIINPAPGETVAPWDRNDRNYADPELCHDHVLGLTGTDGIPCCKAGQACTYTGAQPPPTGNAWYQAVNASSTPFAAFLPANFKWVRVQLKTDNAAPVHVSGDVADGTQVCWDGTYQFRVPGASDVTCRGTAGNGVSGVILTAPGTGYVNPPTVTLLNGGGTGATAHAVMKALVDGQVNSVTMLTNGSGYTTVPTVTISGDGTGAAGQAVIGGGRVLSIALANAGTGCYSTAPAVSIQGGSGTGAMATAVLATSTDCVVSFLSSGSCKAAGGTTSSVTLTGGSGSGAAGTITWKNGNGNFSSSTVSTYGSGYTSAPTGFTGLPGSCSSDVPTGVVLGKKVASFTVTNGGSGYATPPTVTFANGGTGTANISGGGSNIGKVTSIIVTNPGTGYTVPPTVTITGGGGSGATAQANLGATNVVDHVVVDTPGSGYTTAPSVVFFPAGAKGRATIGGGATPGAIYLITAMGYVPRANAPNSPTRMLMQMEAANPPQTFNFNYFTGALTIDGPNPNLENIPNSQNFKILGNDANSCGGTASDPHPSVGVYDDTAVTSVTNSLSSNGAKSENYTGVIGHPNPDVENVYNTLGKMGTTVEGMEALAENISATASSFGTKYGPTYPEVPISSFNPVNTNINSVTYIDGDLTLGGNNHGYGVLLVRGEVILSGDYSWSGPIFVIGKGIYNANGGGNGQITGALIVAKTTDSSGNLLPNLGSPTVNFSGGGGNGIQYDHCWADDLLAKIPMHAPRQSVPLQVLSIRTISY